jgi:hypothetical protein
MSLNCPFIMEEQILDYCNTMIASSKAMTEGVTNEEILHYFKGKRIAYQQVIRHIQDLDIDYNENNLINK